MAEKPMDRQKLLKEIQICSFNVFEAGLYLDTHKTDTAALEYHSKHNAMLKELKAEYAAIFGPLTMGDSNSAKAWEWTDGPWPWELQ